VDEAERGLHDLLLERLAVDPVVDERTSGLVLAAWESEGGLAATVGGQSTTAEPVTAPPREQQPDAYIAAVHVEGFRGIGEPATLPLRPGPGLTLVTGRNGSGKSSFAEAAELALTGESRRWSGRTAVWKDGWRNLHSDGTASVTVDLVTAGVAGTTRVERKWAPGADLDDGLWTRQQGAGEREPFDGSGWRADMQPIARSCPTASWER